MKMCNEMIKLRQGLDNRFIKWEDMSEKSCYSGAWRMIRTHFRVGKPKEYYFSVVWGTGSCGEKEGLLECLSAAVDKTGDPKGYMTADEILHIVDRVCRGLRPMEDKK